MVCIGFSGFISWKLKTYQQLKNDFEEKGLENFELFWFSKPLKNLKSFGLMVL